jgi:three-Cys-motif partner protein
MGKFGGNWTENKIEILVEYAKAYLKIMNDYALDYNWKLLYFDGFAGSGIIENNNKEDQKIIIGAARRILEIDNPRAFDYYHFVELNNNNVSLLRENTKDKFPQKKVEIVCDDCNKQIEQLADFLSKNTKYKTLAFVDPYGMQLNWQSLDLLSKHKVDVWILVPTGIGVNRLLKRNVDEISEAWLKKLETFLGMSKESIINHFYKETEVQTLFGIENEQTKEEKAVEKCAVLYQKRLKEMFAYVSETYVLKNSQNATMFHFLMAANNKTAVKVANDIIKKYRKKQ